MLDLHRDSGFAKIIALIISGTCFEEERDLGTEASGEDTAKKTDLLFCSQLHPHSGYVLLSAIQKYISDHRIPSQGNCETFTPPPES